MITTLTSPRVLRLLFSLLVLSSAPCTGHATEIGELSLLSNLGEPLFATVDVRLGKSEVLNDSCLSLYAVEQPGGASRASLLQTQLTFKFNQVSHKVEIRSLKPFNEPVAILRLQVKCQGTAYASSTLTLMPKFESKQPAQATRPPSIPQNNTATSVTAISVAPDKATLPRHASLAKTEAATLKPNKTTSPDQGQSAHVVYASPALPANTPENNSPQLELRLSADALDLSRIGMLSAKDFELLVAQHKLLDVDDRLSHFAAMQQQMKLMQDEINTLRLKSTMAESASPLVAAAPIAAIYSILPTNWQRWSSILLVLGAIGTVIAALLGLRYLTKPKQKTVRTKHPNQTRLAPPEMQQGMRSIKIATPPESKQILETADAIPLAVMPPEKIADTDELLREEQAVLEEAELYAVYGHADKGIRMLQEFVSRYPQSEKAWMLLLSIYSSCGQVNEFEKSSRNFLSRNTNSPLWRTVQALGRTLEEKNPLYLDETNAGNNDPLLSSDLRKHRPIGDILIELGYLSIQDLENCLGDFDPKQHGRFGNYLLTRRIINHAQLNEALLKQQAGNADGLVSYGLLHLQQDENTREYYRQGRCIGFNQSGGNK